MIDNIKHIRKLMNFSEVGDFYMLYVLKRKKDQPADERDNHQSVRTIKSYCIESVDQLELRYDEIKKLCELFKARAYIHVQKQNHKDVSLNMMVALAQRIQDGNLDQHWLFNKVVGQLRTCEKRWIIDIDNADAVSPLMIAHLEYGCKPFTEVDFDEAGMPVGYKVGPKVEAIIPTNTGFHIITKRFDVKAFNEHYPVVDIHKKNPTLLYYPQSLASYTIHHRPHSSASKR